jgi:hypothetical protein
VRGARRNPRSYRELCTDAYLRHVFTELPKATTQAEIEALLPWNVVLATQSVAA